MLGVEVDEIEVYTCIVVALLLLDEDDGVEEERRKSTGNVGSVICSCEEGELRNVSHDISGNLHQPSRVQGLYAWMTTSFNIQLNIYRNTYTRKTQIRDSVSRLPRRCLSLRYLDCGECFHSFQYQFRSLYRR